MAKSSAKGKKKIVDQPIKTIDAVIPVSTPTGSVHFDEFLNVCRQPKLPYIPIEPVKPSKKDKIKEGKTPKIQIVDEPDIPEKSSLPTLFPLIKALLLPADDDIIEETPLISEFAVGKTNPSIFNNKKSMQAINEIEQQANSAVDKINIVQDQIKIIMQKPKLNERETVELEEQQTLLLKLLNDFENCLEKIRDIYYTEQQENANNDDNDNWFDADDENFDLGKQHFKCNNIEKFDTNKCNIIDKFDTITTKSQKTNNQEGYKWYESADLTYLLSPNTSFDKGVSQSVSSGLIRILDELKDKNNSTQNNAKLNEVFRRLRAKFAILLPPPRSDNTKENLIWLDQQLYKDHRAMLDATKNLKLFMCGNQFELKYNIINALIISMKDAIMSTSPFYYATKDLKTEFVAEQGVLVQELDEFKRKMKDTFLKAGLSDYWKINPESIRLGDKPCFEVTIRKRNSETTNIDPTLNGQTLLSFIHRNPFITKNENCKGIIKRVNSMDSELEVVNTHYD
ncbi:Hypothetical protein CINCED_3A015596 [Cinara cedri]|uniref:Uncharacterized protein n=1 Tax=Cinara cedri TaxID=506608 RepID=A0A5E4MZU9_9HEMI|nr:Hypothetical protein CINCED_3A015596 [Cinara cedri]